MGALLTHCFFRSSVSGSNRKYAQSYDMASPLGGSKLEQLGEEASHSWNSEGQRRGRRRGNNPGKKEETAP